MVLLDIDWTGFGVAAVVLPLLALALFVQGDDDSFGDDDFSGDMQ